MIVWDVAGPIGAYNSETRIATIFAIAYPADVCHLFTGVKSRLAGVAFAAIRPAKPTSAKG